MKKAKRTEHKIKTWKYQREINILEDKWRAFNIFIGVPMKKTKLKMKTVIENPKIYPHKYVQLISDKFSEVVQWSKGSLYNK